MRCGLLSGPRWPRGVFTTKARSKTLSIYSFEVPDLPSTVMSKHDKHAYIYIYTCVYIVVMCNYIKYIYSYVCVCDIFHSYQSVAWLGLFGIMSCSKKIQQLNSVKSSTESIIHRFHPQPVHPLSACSYFLRSRVSVVSRSHRPPPGNRRMGCAEVAASAASAADGCLRT